MLISEDVEAVLSQWAASQGFDVSEIEILRDRIPGTVNLTVLVRIAADIFAVRIRRSLAASVPRSWEVELYGTELAAAQGLAPEIRYFCANPEAMVSDYGGQPLERLSANQISALAEALARLHALEFDPARVLKQTYRRLVDSYFALAEVRKDHGSRVLEDREEITDLADWCDQTSEHCFTHHDLVRGNVLWRGNEPRFIDWEYLRAGHSEFDLATVVETFEMSQEEQLLLRENYVAAGGLSRATRDEQQSMQRFVVLLTDLWAAAVLA